MAFLVLAVYAQLQILLADYVQHYGLRRQTGADGRPEPVGDGHSWNTPHWFSSALMVNAPRHSDHHLHPTRPYPGLRLREHDADAAACAAGDGGDRTFSAALAPGHAARTFTGRAKRLGCAP